MQRAGVFLAAAGLVLASCGPTAEPVPSSTASVPPSLAPPQATASADSSSVPSPEPTGQPSPGPQGRQPTTLIDNLMDRIAAGEWSLGQGLIETLEYLNGERDLDSVVPNAELVEFEASPILERANEFVAKSPDAPEAARIAELYRLIVPTPEQLRQLSAPLQGVTRGAGGIVAGTTVDCSELWRLVPDPPSPGVPCLEVEEFSLPDGGTGRVYIPIDTLEGPDADRFVRLVTEAFQASWRVLEGVADGMPPDLDVVYDPRGLRRASAAATLSEVELCLVLVFPIWLIDPEDDAKFILAHEAAHCFQQYQAYQARDVITNAPPWAAEGSANYLANVVYPEVNLEYTFLRRLRRDEPNHSLLRLSYDAFPFFQYMGNERGNREVVSLLRHLMLESTPESFPDMADIFHGYAEDFLTDRIIDSSGAPIPIDALAQNYGHFRPTEVGPIVEVQPKPFVIERLIIDWEENREFDIDTHQVGELTISAQQWPDGGWAQLPDPVETCAGGKTHRVLVTRVEPAGDASVRLDLTDAQRVDVCLVRITVHGAIEAVFSGGVCYLDDGFLHVTAGFGLSDAEVEQIGPYPRGYGFILATAEPGSEAVGHPNVTITDNERHFTDLGSNAAIVKSADLLTGSFTSDDIFGDYSCPFLTPPDELPGLR